MSREQRLYRPISFRRGSWDHPEEGTCSLIFEHGLIACSIPERRRQGQYKDSKEDDKKGKEGK